MKATEVTAGLAESNGSLLPGLWRDSLQRHLRADCRDQLRAQRSETSMGKLYLFYDATASSNRLSMDVM